MSASVKKNYALNLAYQILALILPLVTSPYLSRVLGAERIGVYSYTYSVAYYFVLFAMLGVNNYGNREISRTKRDSASLARTFWSIWRLQALLGVASTAGYISYSFFLSGDVLTSLVWVPYVLSAALDINWFFFGLEEFEVTVLRNACVKLVTFFLTFVFVRDSGDLIAYLLLMSISLAVSVAILWPFVPSRVERYKPSPSEVFGHLKPNLVLFVPVIAVSFYTVLDKVMLGSMSGMTETGYFENSLKVAQMPFTLITALGTVMMPRASALVAQGKSKEALSYMRPSMWLAMMLSFAFSFGITAVAPEFVPVFFGSGFDACVGVMSLIVWEMPFMAWSNVVRTQYLMPLGLDRAYVCSVITGAVANVVVNITLIPSMGAIGAAWGTLAAEGVVCAAQTAACKDSLPIGKWAKDSIIYFLIGVVMAATVRLASPFLPSGSIGLLLEILLGALMFSVLSLIHSLFRPRSVDGVVVRRLRSEISEKFQR